jgi:DNA modification methylase
MSKCCKSKLICADNLKALDMLIKDGVKVNLIYLDPPFFSNRHYEVIWGDEAEVRSFEDRWEGGINVYIEWMRERVQKMYELLKDTGSFYLHCDWHASHYLKVMLDQVFGYNKFRNEIIWNYHDPAGTTKTNFKKKHDTILFYSKSDFWTFNTDAVREPYGKKTLNDGLKGIISFGRKTITNPGGKVREDVWQIPFINSQAKERLGYPTQKPESLLEIIIKASSNEGNLVLDPFCGCGTAIAVAQKLKRKWIGIDISPTAIKIIIKRLEKLGTSAGKDFKMLGMPTTLGELQALKPFEFQNWVIDEMGAKQSKTLSNDLGIDGYYDKTIFIERAGIQVKQSEGIGREVVDKFETALTRGKFKRGFIVAIGFTKGAYEEAARVKGEGLEIRLIKVEDLLLGKAKL